MHYINSLLAACALVSGAAAVPRIFERQGNTPNSEGTHEGYYYSWWSDGASPATYTNEQGGAYSVQWQSGGNLVGGKGWNPGTDRDISYSADWYVENNGNSYITIYGWTRNPLVEYYVVEAHGEYNPCSQGEARGSLEMDGSSYELCESTRHNAPSIDGDQTFQQYWAIRNQHRTSGTVNMGTVFQAWENAGMPLGNHYYQIVATEAYQSAGQASVNVQSPP
ncbi:glycoside hydrolase family 11 protein [Sodiomyces alcalophilus JCM 7366]|uniref:glycoside hydrolase family 11 protein n=1 Tax=Sodiomyces alcalophilus JCM 7366 TaxID=591952 RepID=UPI0039B623E2